MFFFLSSCAVTSPARPPPTMATVVDAGASALSAMPMNCFGGALVLDVVDDDGGHAASASVSVLSASEAVRRRIGRQVYASPAVARDHGASEPRGSKQVAGRARVARWTSRHMNAR